jgi:DNA invertase Pin-like site-specific DNA recombinase
MEGVLAAFAQFDNDVRSDRTRAGMRAALELGRWTFPAPLGYLTRETTRWQRLSGAISLELFISQRLRRIELRRPTCGQIRRSQRDSD